MLGCISASDTYRQYQVQSHLGDFSYLQLFLFVMRNHNSMQLLQLIEAVRQLSKSRHRLLYIMHAYFTTTIYGSSKMHLRGCRTASIVLIDVLSLKTCCIWNARIYLSL